MALWPFRRKSGRKRSRSGAALSDAEGPPPSRSQTVNDADADADATPATARTASKKKQRTNSQPPSNPGNKKLQRRPRTYSFSPGRNDSIRVAGKDTLSGPQGPGRPTRLPPGGQVDEEKEEDEWDWHRAPTLYNTRNDAKMKRKKSSNRRRQDHDREAEIKAMAGFAPLWPANDSATIHGRPMKKDTKRVKTTMGRNSAPTSDISLPMPESIDSRMSSDSEHAKYKVFALDSLAPRPTLRCDVHPRYGPPGGSEPGRTPSQRKRLTEPGSVPEATLKAHKRIDSLADDLDASDLRELMERDKRRRERKVQRDQERLQRRLTRRAEEQRREEAEANKSGTPPPQNLERGVIGREALGLGIETTSTVVTSSRRRPSDASHQGSNKTPEGRSSPEGAELHQAVGHFHRVSSIPPETPAIPQEAKAPATPPPESPKVNSRASFLRYKKSQSKTSLASDGKQTLSTLPPTSDTSEPSRRDSETSARGKRTLSSLFKWGTIKRSRSRKAPSGAPPSFSNTSREEMQADAQAKAVAHAQALARLQKSQSAEQLPERIPTATSPMVAASAIKKMSSGMPKRTRSRFREDLPELPMSPPDSRQASVDPEAEPPLPVVSEVKSNEDSLEGTPAIPIRYDTPASERRTIDETMRQTPTSAHRSTQPSPQPQSVSLASIDSEGSWLSGRINKRSSSGMGMRDSVSRTYNNQNNNINGPYGKMNRRSHQSTSNNTEEGQDFADDEHLVTLATPEPHQQRDRSSDEDEPMNMSMDEDEDATAEAEAEAGMKWGSVGARQHAVHTEVKAEMMRSHEGLLNSVKEGKGGNSSPSEGGHTPHLQRAESVNFGSKGHVRHMSAGSAKLLDITPRASVDAQSSGRRGSEPMVM